MLKINSYAANVFIKVKVFIPFYPQKFLKDYRLVIYWSDFFDQIRFQVIRFWVSAYTESDSLVTHLKNEQIKKINKKVTNDPVKTCDH